MHEDECYELRPTFEKAERVKRMITSVVKCREEQDARIDHGFQIEPTSGLRRYKKDSVSYNANYGQNATFKI